MALGHKRIYLVIVWTTGLLALASCSLQPSSDQGARRSSSDLVVDRELLSGDKFGFVRLSSMLPLLDYSESYFLTPHFKEGFFGVTLSDSAGSIWSVCYADVSKSKHETFDISIRSEVRLVQTNSGHVWVFSGNRISRSAEPYQSDFQLQEGEDDVQIVVGNDLRGWSTRAKPEELKNGRSLDVVYVDENLVVVRSKDALITYQVSNRAITRRSLVPPANKDWEKINVAAVGRGKDQKGLWVLADEFLYYTDDPIKPQWQILAVEFQFEEEVKTIAAQIPLSFDIESNQLRIKAPILVLTDKGFFGYYPNGDFASSRRFQPEKSYDWAAVKPLALDYCVPCHSGFLGYESKEDWLRNVDFLKSVVHLDNIDAELTMPPKGSLERDRISDDERAIMVSWLQSEGAQKIGLGSEGQSEDESGPNIFRLGPELEQAIAFNTAANCLNCHSSGADNMHLASWWLNPVRNGRTGLNGLEASIATMGGATPRMPPGGGLSDAERERIVELMNALEFE